MKAIKNILAITAIIYGILFLGSVLPINFNFINPFKKSLSDYEYTDVIFSKFKSLIDFDNRIVLVNVGKPDRMKIGQAIEKIEAYQAKTIGVDIVFEGAKEEKIDSFLESTIKRYDNIVLAVELPFESIERAPFVCSERFCNEGNSGFINFVAKPNETIRYFSPMEPVEEENILFFSTSIVKKYDWTSFNYLRDRKKEVEQIFYRGSADSYVQIDIDDVLGGENLMESIFKDKIVLMGYMGDSEWALSARDKFFTPLNRTLSKKALPDMYGLVIHANIISMVLDRDYIDDAPAWLCRLINFLLIVGFVIFSRYVYIDVNAGYWRMVRITQLALISILFFVMAASFYFLQVKIGLGIALLGIAIAWELTNLYYNLIVKRQKFINKEKNL